LIIIFIILIIIIIIIISGSALNFKKGVYRQPGKSDYVNGQSPSAKNNQYPPPHTHPRLSLLTFHDLHGTQMIHTF